MNTNDFLSIANAICPDRDAVVFEGKSWTFAELNERSNRFAHALKKAGVQKGDRVGMIHVNCNQHIEAYFATAKLGAIFVPLNYRAKSAELSYMINNAEVKVLLVGSRYLSLVDGMLTQLPTVTDYVSVDKKIDGKNYYEQLIGTSPTDEIISEISDDDITFLMYTSGTTGRPKGVPLSHNSFVSYVLGNLEPASPEAEQRNLLCVPLYHIAGIQAMLAAVYGGRTIILMRQFDTNEWLGLVQQEHVTRAMLVPTMLKWVIDDPDFNNFDLSSLKVITYGAAPMPSEVIRRAIKALPWVRFINAFGQTETGSTITVLEPDDHVIEGTEDEKAKKLKRLSSSIGKALPGVEVAIASDSGDILPPHATGEIIAKGPMVMEGYWRDDKKTSQTITKDGWLRTGDKGWIDEDGYVYLAGRGDDMIIRGGENISPEEIEDVLYCHPDIDEAAVIGLPDPEWGQQPCAVVVVKIGRNLKSEMIIEYCRAKLASFKKPRRVVFIDKLPRNSMGKILKKELYAKYA